MRDGQEKRRGKHKKIEERDTENYKEMKKRKYVLEQRYWCSRVKGCP